MSAYSTATIHFDDGFSTLHPFLNQTTHIYLFDKPIYMFIFWNCFLPTMHNICCWIYYTVKMLWLKVWCLRAAWRTEVGILYYEIYKDACFCYVMCLLQCRLIKKVLHNLCNNNFILKWNCTHEVWPTAAYVHWHIFALWWNELLCKVLASSWPISMMLPNKVLMRELCVLQHFEIKSEFMIV